MTVQLLAHKIMMQFWKLRPREPIQYLASAPSQLGIARAYVNGDLEIVGDAYTTLSRLYPMDTHHLTRSDKITLWKKFAPFAFKRPKPPAQERVLAGTRHSKRRDAEAIQHHYDVSNRFYRWVLGPSMAYTCAVFPTEDASLEAGSRRKIRFGCSKIRP